jgi:predicted Fe-Mo cluster-binding NifX family protein
MKIAAITDDGKTISQHFGRAAHYLVCTVEDGKVVETELRDKMGHRHFANDPHAHDEENDPRGHGFGPSSDRKHDQMIAAITDCEALLVRGMGRGAYIAVESANIKPVVTEHALIEDAVQAYIDGNIVDHTEKLH